MCYPGYICLTLLLQETKLFTGSSLSRRCLGFTVLTFGFLFTMSAGIMPYLFGGGYTYVSHSVSCQPGPIEGEQQHRAEVVYHFFGSVMIYWVVFFTSILLFYKYFKNSGNKLELLLKPSTTSLLILVYLLCFLPESLVESVGALRIFNWVGGGETEEGEENEVYEQYGHVVMAVILPVFSSALNFLVHFRDIIKFPTVIQYEINGRNSV